MPQLPGERQIQMCWLRKEPTPSYFPEGYTVKNYQGTAKERLAFYRIWCNKDGTQEESDKLFTGAFVKYRDCNPSTDVFFVYYGEEIMGSITAIYHKRENAGYVHMVGIRDDFRGKHLSKPLNYLAMKKIYEDGGSYAWLTTNDWRENAIRGYIKAGFLPQMNAFMPKQKRRIVERWAEIYEKLELGKLTILSAKKRKPLDLTKYGIKE